MSADNNAADNDAGVLHVGVLAAWFGFVYSTDLNRNFTWSDVKYMIKNGFLGLIAVFLSGCSAHIDRKETPDAWYYERLTPYYTNDLYLSPRVHLRAVRELVGKEIVLADGTPAHADFFRDDIELFFARPIDDPKERARLIDEALLNTCPDTDRSDLRSRISYADQTYVVLQNVSCIGFATHGS